MIGLIFGLFESAVGGVLSIPYALAGLMFSFFTLFGCIKCMRCRIRDCYCIKRLLRCSGHDQFDDFNLMVLVHETILEHSPESRTTTYVRVTAGRETVKTDSSSNGLFQQPLHIGVEQGTNTVVIDLLDSSKKVLATLTLDPMQDVLSQSPSNAEKVYTMSSKRSSRSGYRGTNPKLKLTLVVQRVSSQEDTESGILEDSRDRMNSDVDILVRQQLRKSKAEASKDKTGGEEVSQFDILMQAGSGPLEIFEGLGSTRSVFVAVLGPPKSRRWVLSVWPDFAEYQCKRNMIVEVDLLKVESIIADPARHHVFVINYIDSSRIRQTMTFRRIDRNRDVWVEILHLLVSKARDAKRAAKLAAKDRHSVLSDRSDMESSARSRASVARTGATE